MKRVKVKVTQSGWLFAIPWLYSPWNSPGKNTGVGSLSLLQGIFPTQGLNPGLPHCRQILYQLSQKGSPRILEWVAYPFSRGSSWPRNQTGVSCIAGGFFTNWAIRGAQMKRECKFKVQNSPLKNRAYLTWDYLMLLVWRQGIQRKTVEFKVILCQRDIDRWKIENAASRIEIW